jgi:aspartate aminotransferase-like enzyme
LPLFTQAPLISDTVTVFAVPDGRDGSAVVRHLHERYGTVIAGARNRLKGKVLRIGTMGHIEESDILMDLLYLEKTLEDLGWPILRGAGTNAAKEALGHA